MTGVLWLRGVAAVFVFLVALVGAALTYIGIEGSTQIAGSIGNFQFEVNTAFPGVAVTLASLIGLVVLGMPTFTHTSGQGGQTTTLRGRE